MLTYVNVCAPPADTRSECKKRYQESVGIFKNEAWKGPQIIKNNTLGSFLECLGQHSISGSRKLPRWAILLKVLCATWSVLGAFLDPLDFEGVPVF